MLVHGETGGGEAYMDGLWSSPDLVGLLRLAALNREALALSTGLVARLAQLRRTAPIGRGGTRAVRAAGTSRRTTTSATTSTGSSSTRR